MKFLLAIKASLLSFPVEFSFVQVRSCSAVILSKEPPRDSSLRSRMTIGGSAAKNLAEYRSKDRERCMGIRRKNILHSAVKIPVCFVPAAKAARLTKVSLRLAFLRRLAYGNFSAALRFFAVGERSPLPKWKNE